MEEKEPAGAEISFLDILKKSTCFSHSKFNILSSQVGRHKTALIQNRDGKILFLKTAADSLNSKNQITLEGEILFYQSFLSNHFSEEFRSHIPELLEIIDDKFLLYEGYNDHLNLHSALSNHQISADVFNLLGRCLAILHSAPDPGNKGYRQIKSPVITHGHITPEVLVNKPYSYAHLLRLIQQVPLINAQLRTLRQSWNLNACIHGDFKSDNILVSKDEVKNLHDLLITDWELFGRGDAHWDCGSLIGSVYFTNLEGIFFSAKKTSDENDWELVHLYVRKFLSAYKNNYTGPIDLGMIFGWAGYWIINKITETLDPHQNLSKFELAAMHLAQQLLKEIAEP